MHFKGLKIVGFKSFADPVDFAIREGLTGIVGPNGCGKSNILESLRWVMGATSARAMRGGEMDDLIFSGSSNRPQRENAEVALLLDNSARRAPVELNDSDEIEVKRRLRRGAGSTYKINGKTVRAKDVQLLFADASTGANSPALVRQGQISELIASKPQNRRRILEEAAGISGLNQRRHEAELKLRGAADSLSRLDEIIGEVDKQLNSLKRQASRAKKYRILQEQIEVLEAQIAFYRWQAARQDLADANTNIKQASLTAQETAAAEASAIATELEFREKIPSLRDIAAEASAQLGILKIENARLDGERKAASDAVLRLEQDLKRIVEDQAREHALREEADASSMRAKESLSSLPEENEDRFQAKQSKLRAKLLSSQENLAKAQSEADTLSQAIAIAQAEANSAQRNLERALSNEARLATELKHAQENLSSLDNSGKYQKKKATVEKALRDAEAKLSAGTVFAEQAEEDAQAARIEEKESLIPLQEAEKSVRILEAEIAGLKRLVGKASSGQFAPILDETHPEEGLERALAAALGDDLNASTNTSDSQFWSNQHAQMTTPLPTGAISLASLVRAPSALAARLSQCGVIDAEDGEKLQSQLQQGQRLVSREGDLWRWDGFVRTAKAPSSASEKLEQRSQIAKLENQLSSEKKKAEKLKLVQQKASEKLQNAQETARTTQKALPHLTQLASRAKEDVMQNDQALERLSLRSASAQDNISRISSALSVAKEEIETTQKAILGGPSHADQKSLESLRHNIVGLRDKERTAHTAFHDLENDHARSKGRRIALEREYKDWLNRCKTAESRLDDLQSQRTGVRLQLENTKAQPEKIDAQLTQLQDTLIASRLASQTASDALSVAETELRNAETESRRSKDISSRAREDLIRKETRLESAELREQEISDNVQAKFLLNFEDLAKIIEALPSSLEAADGDILPESHQEAFNISKAEAQLASLLRERDSLGGVNMEADLQVEETAQRLELQLREREDLDKAIAKLQEGVHALNAQGRKLLLEAFEKVAEHFRVLFEALFEGGEAQLKLTESDDPLQAGLEIFASPPGKRLSALSLMSGGEQALTATALIFAVFLSQPSPLCVLDEVDAPLDDANVDRFCRMLDTMRSKTDTRFVAITHNPVTMSRMDRLYGVTMQERGVSRLVSVDLQSAEQLVAAQ